MKDEPMLPPFHPGLKLIIGFRGTHPEHIEKIAQYAGDKLIGGVILFGHNIMSPDQLFKLTDFLRRAQPNLLIGIDQEGGQVARLSSAKGFHPTPSAHALSLLSDEEIRGEYKKLAEQLKTFSINLNFAPCVDLTPYDKNCPVISDCQRSYGHSKQEIVRCAQIFIEEHRKCGVLTSVKHFPGHGYASSDTHKELADITHRHISEEEDIYFELEKKGLIDTLMVGHLIHQKWDPHLPASLSPHIIKRRLREKGFQKVIVSDDLHMGAVLSLSDVEEAMLQALYADLDILCFSNNHLAAGGNPRFQYQEELPFIFARVVERALKEETILKDTIENSLRRLSFLNAFKA